MRRNNLFLHYPLSHLHYTKYFADDFLHDELLHLPFELMQNAIIGLVLSVTASSCQCSPNEPSRSGFQLHSIGSGMLVSNSLSFQK